jgi:hypothetical protein
MKQVSLHFKARLQLHWAEVAWSIAFFSLYVFPHGKSFAALEHLDSMAQKTWQLSHILSNGWVSRSSWVACLLCFGFGSAALSTLAHPFVTGVSFQLQPWKSGLI